MAAWVLSNVGSDPGPSLLRAVIKVESDFRSDAVSRKGAVGLMQLMPETAATLRVADINDPIQNIRGGAKQLRHLLKLYKEGKCPASVKPAPM